MSQEIIQLDLEVLRNNFKNTYQNEYNQNSKLFYHLTSICFYLIEKYNLDSNTDFFYKSKNLYPFISNYYRQIKDGSFEFEEDTLKNILGGTTKFDDEKWSNNTISFESEIRDDLQKFVESFSNIPVSHIPEGDLKKPNKIRKTSQPNCECNLCYKTNFVLNFLHNKDTSYFPIPKSSTHFQKIKIFRDDQVGISNLFQFINLSFQDSDVMAVLVYEFLDEQDQMWTKSNIKFVKSYTNLKLDFTNDGDWFVDYDDDEVFQYLDEGKILGIFYEKRKKSVSFRKVDGIYVMTSSVDMNNNKDLVFLKE